MNNAREYKGVVVVPDFEKVLTNLLEVDPTLIFALCLGVFHNKLRQGVTEVTLNNLICAYNSLSDKIRESFFSESTKEYSGLLVSSPYSLFHPQEHLSDFKKSDKCQNEQTLRYLETLYDAKKISNLLVSVLELDDNLLKSLRNAVWADADTVEAVETFASEDTVEAVETFAGTDTVEAVETFASEDIVETVKALADEDMVDTVEVLADEDIVAALETLAGAYSHLKSHNEHHNVDALLRTNTEKGTPSYAGKTMSSLVRLLKRRRSGQHNQESTQDIKDELEDTSEKQIKKQKSTRVIVTPAREIENKLITLKYKLDTEYVNKLINTYVSIDDKPEGNRTSVDHNGGVYSTPENRAIEIIFTWLACTEGLGFSAVFVSEDKFEAFIAEEKNKIKTTIDNIKKSHEISSDKQLNQSIFGATNITPQKKTKIWSSVQDRSTREMLKSTLLFEPGQDVPNNFGLGNYRILAYTELNEVLMASTSDRKNVPNYAIYLGQSNIFENCDSEYDCTDDLNQLKFDENRVNSKAIDITKATGYDEKILSTLKEKYGSSVLVYSQKRTNTKEPARNWYALFHMKKLDSDCCAICIENYEEVDIKGEHCILQGCSHIFHKECIQEWCNEKKTGYSLCPLCRKRISIGPERDVICVGQKIYNRTWVTYVMELERNLLKKFREDKHLDSLDYTVQAFRQILAECTYMLKRWFFYRPRKSARSVNRKIALVILLYKYSVLIIAGSYSSNEGITWVQEMYARHGFDIYKNYKRYVIECDASLLSSLQSTVEKARNSSGNEVGSNLEAEIESNLVFPKGYLTTA